MNKYYLFMANGKINRDLFDNAIEGVGIPFEISYFDDASGYILADESFAVRLQPLIFPIHDDLGITLSVVSVHKIGDLEKKAAREALSYFPNQCLYLSDVLMKEFSFGDFSSLPFLSAEFKGVGHDLMLTSGAFLRCGLNASLAAETIFIHRNTFNYRLEKFIDLTSLDIRDYHNALVLEIYFQLGNPKK
ncbi:MAG: helix-turn-helix domain-containing protein [Bacilli bacterium]|jgi:hypothetical protein|nr:helix-turn-helix domain-containing protein [Bacilli bacterium]MCH4210597.1 helix-turn-helix domain-containing protein [Bacilli bacterium]MCH4228555.1 helix-turn-helix domain-containing protein [Bacilli bacterium]MCH4277309.1 helix-turn-helix domain-containing protein [Bacilli bacterium]MCI2055221.1 helix-turn-helix domain-containing protein [Bacilli bacterium]